MSLDPNPSYAEAELLASASRSADDAGSAASSFAGHDTLRCLVAVDSVSGGGPVKVFLEDTVDGTHWARVATLFERSSFAAPTVEATNITTPFADQLRVRWELNGATVTFSVNVAARS